MADRRVALLRGVNVGTAKRVAMADLRALAEGLGYRDVRTLLNSGNIVFTMPAGPSHDPAARIEEAIAAGLGVATRVTVLRAKDLAAAIRDNPLTAVADNPSRLLLMACAASKTLARLTPLLREHWAPDALAVGPSVAYIWCAEGIAHSRLWTAAHRALGDAGTARNLATMTKLLAMLEAS